MKIVAAGDLHYTDKRPAFRVDGDFFAFMLELTERMLMKAVKVGSPAILVPGDFLNERRVSNIVHEALVTLFRQYPGIKIITTLGQHDVRSHDIHSYRIDSDMRLLEIALHGQLIVLKSGEHTILEDKEGRTLAVFGFGFNEPDTIAFLNGRFSSPVKADYKMAVVHADISQEQIKDQLVSGVDFAVFGDHHTGFEPYDFGSTVAFSCGVMTPMRTDELLHYCTYAVVDLEAQTIKFVPHEHPDQKLFVDFDYIANTKTFGVEKAPVLDIEAFRAAVEAAKKKKMTDEELLDSVAGKNRTPKNVVRLIKGYMMQ